MKKINIKKWNGPDAITCARDLARKPYSLFFDSNRPSHPFNKWSFICYDPIETIETKNNIITHNGKVIDDSNFFDFLQSRLNQYDFQNLDNDIPFIGGAAGYFGYDLGRQLETIPLKTVDNLNISDACIGIYTNVLAFKQADNTAWFIGENPPELGAIPPSPYITHDIKWTSNKTDNDYCNDIQKVIDYIYAGEIYQANLSRQFTANLPKHFSTFNHYEYLRRINPAPYSAYMNFNDFQISSCSPEQFLSIKNNVVTTRPIKGTRPSSENPNLLRTSKKDIAENTMIVDLLRNDISKFCDFHTVKAPKICEVETFEGLHHLVSTVTGNLKKDMNAVDALKACFPGGSITGAPKIRAMAIIEELETYQRGAYCGSMGYIGFDGNMDSNIIIRTLIYKNNKAYLNLGGGIVSDSIPLNELQETYDKGIKIFESFKNKNKEKIA